MCIIRRLRYERSNFIAHAPATVQTVQQVDRPRPLSFALQTDMTLHACMRRARIVTSRPSHDSFDTNGAEHIPDTPTWHSLT